MKLIHTITIGCFVALLSSCSISGPYTYPKALVTKNSVGTKVGIAEKKAYFGIMFGDADLSITTAAKKGNITKVATVDQEIVSGFIVTKFRTKVTGE
ncbi:TRL-like family protein [Vicingaceae bacterium]|jgi:hypothetical protein|nr:TRL-like family protein [Vicingaceae bacterium]